MPKVLVVELHITVVDTVQVTNPSDDDTFPTYDARITMGYQDPNTIIEGLARVCGAAGDAEALAETLKEAAQESENNDGAEVHRTLTIKREGYRVPKGRASEEPGE